jgi:hypothetical protein
MEIFDLETLLWVVMFIPTILAILLVYILIGAYILMHLAISALVRVLRPPVRRIYSFVCEKLSMMLSHLAPPMLGKAADHETQQLALVYLVILAHHWPHF